jgi:hypothetical protein
MVFTLRCHTSVSFSPHFEICEPMSSRPVGKLPVPACSIEDIFRIVSSSRMMIDILTCSNIVQDIARSGIVARKGRAQYQQLRTT